jgi:hypothetical protein
MQQVYLFLFFLNAFVNCFSQQTKSIHVFVALCDNKYQGIVPVGASIGNGQDPDNNLYWGCNYGVRTYFKKSKEWQFIAASKPGGVILERIIFKHRTKNYFLVADAYDGRSIKECTIDFLNSCSGALKQYIRAGSTIVGTAGNATLLAYIGHNGLMDFKMPMIFQNKDGIERKAIILACISKGYFTPYLQQANARPLLWTTGLMAPEAYTLYDAISGFLNGENDESIRSRGAQAYSRFQKCSLKASRNLLVTGW